jgi:hypothetical protein
MLSHADDNAVESCWQWYCQGDLAVVRCKYRVMLATMLLSCADDDAVEATWLWHDVDIESC